MAAPLGAVNAEVAFTLVLTDEPTQGVGFYLRQNGGYLQQTTPAGAGYAVFVEGSFRSLAGIGVWKEENGQEIELAHSQDLLPVEGVAYRVRFRVLQDDASTTRLQAKIWEAAEPEPLAWQLDHLDATASLQGVAGGMAIDSWSVLTSGITEHTLVDDVVVLPLVDPRLGVTGPTTVDDTLLFAEGPVWRDDHLLFSDLDADAIYRLDPPAARSSFHTPSGESNGLALDLDGSLLAAQQAERRVARIDDLGTETVVVDSYQGSQLNSPNDLVVRSDGTLYFTDPDYGLPGPRELAFNGLFRLPPGQAPVAEWEGSPPDNEPNGVALSPDESTLYVSDSGAGEVLAWSVAPDGVLSNPRLFASGLTIPDGMCVDHRGNLWVASWAPRLEVYSPDGGHWGGFPLPAPGTNCAFGGADGRDLYVTAQSHLLRYRVLTGGATRP
jgi:gluconolactonase